MKNSDKNKIKLWRERLKELEEIELAKVLKKLGESITQGDWHENIEFEEAQRQVELIQARIDEIKSLIKQLEA